MKQIFSPFALSITPLLVPDLGLGKIVEDGILRISLGLDLFPFLIDNPYG
jgi:hypothetical protein